MKTIAEEQEEILERCYKANQTRPGWFVLGSDSVTLCLGGQSFWIGNGIRVKAKTRKRKG